MVQSHPGSPPSPIISICYIDPGFAVHLAAQFYARLMRWNKALPAALGTPRNGCFLGAIGPRRAAGESPSPRLPADLLSDLNSRCSPTRRIPPSSAQRGIAPGMNPLVQCPKYFRAASAKIAQRTSFFKYITGNGKRDLARPAQ
jgi:hypothetical protein